MHVNLPSQACHSVPPATCAYCISFQPRLDTMKPRGPAVFSSRSPTFRRLSIFLPAYRRPRPHPCSTPVCSSKTPRTAASAESGDDDDDDFVTALEVLFEEALLSYYEGAPLFTEAEFQTLRDELEFLGSSSVRLSAMEKLWALAAQERDFDRRVRNELGLSVEDLSALKGKLISSRRMRSGGSGGSSGPAALTPLDMAATARPPRPASAAAPATAAAAALRGWRGGGGTAGAAHPGADLFAPRPARSFGVADAEAIRSNERVDERLRWLLFATATEERLKIALLYLPAVLMSFVTATFFTVLFALLDGEMRITVTSVGRVRLGIMSYIVVTLTVWFSNKVTPTLLEFLDLGQPQLLRGNCPNCNGTVSCLFTSSSRVRDERKCSVCGAVVGFNSKWRKIYLVARPGARKYSMPD